MNKRGSKHLDLVEQIKKDFPVSRCGNEKNARVIWAVKIKSAIASANTDKTDDLCDTNPMGIRDGVDFDRIRAEAASIIQVNKDNKLLISQFVRPGKRELSKVITDIESGKVYKKFRRNTPVGALVAFVTNDKLMVGWSKHSDAKELTTDSKGNKILKNKEVLPFSKKTAVLIAVMRGLLDRIEPSGKGSYITNKNKYIPKAITNDISTFVKRVEKYFERQAVNVGRFQGTG